MNKEVQVNCDDIYQLFSLMFRDHTAATYKNERAKVKLVCPICNTLVAKGQIQAVHKTGYTRKELVIQIINLMFKNNPYSLIKVSEVRKRYIEIHKKEKIVAIACRNCHKEYNKNETHIHRKYFLTAK